MDKINWYFYFLQCKFINTFLIFNFLLFGQDKSFMHRDTTALLSDTFNTQMKDWKTISCSAFKHWKDSSLLSLTLKTEMPFSTAVRGLSLGIKCKIFVWKKNTHVLFLFSLIQIKQGLKHSLDWKNFGKWKAKRAIQIYHVTG